MTVYQRPAKRLNHFHFSCLRKLLNIKWQDKIQDMEVLKKAVVQSMHTVLKLEQLRWTDHVIRMLNVRLPKKVIWRTTRGKAPSRWPEETLQRHPQCLSEGFRYTSGVLGTDCTGAIKLARSHQQRSSKNL